MSILPIDPLVSKQEKDIGIHLQVQQKQEYKFFGQINLPKGMTLWAVTIETGDLEKVIIQRKVSVSIETKKPVFESQAQYDPKKVYLVALNKKNAVRKYNKYLLDAMDKVRRRRETAQ